MFPRLVRKLLLGGTLTTFAMSCWATVCDRTAPCPYDGDEAYSTGHEKCDNFHGCRAEYSHTLRSYDDAAHRPGITHTFWASCQ